MFFSFHPRPWFFFAFTFFIFVCYQAIAIEFPEKPVWVVQAMGLLVPALVGRFLFVDKLRGGNRMPPLKIRGGKGGLSKIWFLIATPGFVFLIQLAASFWMQICSPPSAIEKFYEHVVLQANNGWNVALLIVVPAVSEETLFRGFLQKGLRGTWSPLKCMWSSALIFSLAHLNTCLFPLYLILGLYLAWIYQRTNRLVFPILVHALNNGIALFLFFNNTSR